MIIDVIAGARPNFMKIAALYAVAQEFPALQLRFIHTGQHYDFKMSDAIIQQLRLPEPDCHLGVGSGSHAQQTADIMKGYEKWVDEQHPDACLVVGDVNSTVACALVAAKAVVPVAHVEAGLRSFDRTMPEEINRILTDSLSQWMFVTEASGIANLAREGRPLSGIHLVGHVMIDTLLRMLPAARPPADEPLQEGAYAFVTLHRPSNVDDPAILATLVEQLVKVAEHMPVFFPVHPRTRARLQAAQLWDRLAAHVRLTEPVTYTESLWLTKNARVVITDSGGLQEESTVLNVPCLTLRENTERPVTVSAGTSTLIGRDWALFQRCIEQIVTGSYKRTLGQVPYWDGNAGRRIMAILSQSA
ncbi:MAG: UDP-N-acetylglucosamine 2-epimerase (non-hydrolyzing) [Chloroflexi bacterium]|nr:UDP-N-acetylglucosamine 2-epimerase (non-hydrolyzing) [Chloroflexota bacterium]